MQRLSRFWQELKRRNVVRRNAVYAATAFVVLEFVSIIQEPLNLPEWTLVFMIILLSVGFVISIIISWIYDLNPEGVLEKTKAVSSVAISEEKPASSKWKIASIISFVVIAALIAVNFLPGRARVMEKPVLEKSIAVLPFINDSPDETNAYFINGAMEAILDNLSKIEDLRVVSRTSVEQYRNNLKSIPEIAREMNVSYILEGSGQKQGDQIRLMVQLLDAVNDEHLWSKPFNREIKDIFLLQNEIAQLVAGEIEAIITPEEQQLIDQVETSNMIAYDLHQRGLEEITRWIHEGKKDPDALTKAENLYRIALEYDPEYADVYLALANIYWHWHWQKKQQGGSDESSLDSVLVLANRALAINDKLSSAYHYRGQFYGVKGEDDRAMKEFKRAIKLNPNNVDAYAGIARLYRNKDPLKSLENYHRALSLEPGRPSIWIKEILASMYQTLGFQEKTQAYLYEIFNWNYDSLSYFSQMSRSKWLQGDFSDGLLFAIKAFDLDSSGASLSEALAMNYFYLRQYDQALIYFDKYRKTRLAQNRPVYRDQYIGFALIQTGKAKEGEELLKQGIAAVEEWKSSADNKVFPSQVLGSYYSALGEKQKFLDHLNDSKAGNEMGWYYLVSLRHSPYYDIVRNHPEFIRFLAEAEKTLEVEYEQVRLWLEENGLTH